MHGLRCRIRCSLTQTGWGFPTTDITYFLRSELLTFLAPQRHRPVRRPHRALRTGGRPLLPGRVETGNPGRNRRADCGGDLDGHWRVPGVASGAGSLPVPAQGDCGEGAAELRGRDGTGGARGARPSGRRREDEPGSGAVPEGRRARQPWRGRVKRPCGCGRRRGLRGGSEVEQQRRAVCVPAQVWRGHGGGAGAADVHLGIDDWDGIFPRRADSPLAIFLRCVAARVRSLMRAIDLMSAEPVAHIALIYSCIVTGVILLVFGAVKARVTGAAGHGVGGYVWGAVSTLLVGGAAAAAAYGLVAALET